MEIKKQTEVIGNGVPTAAQLESINAQAKAKLTEEQVYVFSVRRCDDQVARDGERFDTAALPALAVMPFRVAAASITSASSALRPTISV